MSALNDTVHYITATVALTHAHAFLHEQEPRLVVTFAWLSTASSLIRRWLGRPTTRLSTARCRVTVDRPPRLHLWVNRWLPQPIRAPCNLFCLLPQVQPRQGDVFVVVLWVADAHWLRISELVHCDRLVDTPLMFVLAFLLALLDQPAHAHCGWWSSGGAQAQRHGGGCGAGRAVAWSSLSHCVRVRSVEAWPAARARRLALGAAPGPSRE
jgi:hypothetical protein